MEKIPKNCYAITVYADKVQKTIILTKSSTSYSNPLAFDYVFDYKDAFEIIKKDYCQYPEVRVFKLVDILDTTPRSICS